MFTLKCSGQQWRPAGDSSLDYLAAINQFQLQCFRKAREEKGQAFPVLLTTNTKFYQWALGVYTKLYQWEKKCSPSPAKQMVPP